MLTKLCYHHCHSPSICALAFFLGLVRVASNVCGMQRRSISGNVKGMGGIEIA